MIRPLIIAYVYYELEKRWNVYSIGRQTLGETKKSERAGTYCGLVQCDIALVSSTIESSVLSLVVGQERTQAIFAYNTNVFDFDVPLDGKDFPKADSRLFCQVCTRISGDNFDWFFSQSSLTLTSKQASFWIYAVVVDKCMLAGVTAALVGSLIPIC